jgi:signal transduction histidine kinase
MSTLARLRLAFIALGSALLLSVAGLLQSAMSSLEQQRFLRHRMIAERVFDEAEREIGNLLQHEAERPSAAYDTVDTDPMRWGRFIVGYYRRDPELRLIAEADLDPARTARVRAAVLRARPELDARAAGIGSDAPGHSGAQAKDPEDEPIATRSPDVLRQLNRSVKVRERRQHDFAASFAVVSAGQDTLVVERAGEERREGFVMSVSELVATIQSWVLSAQGLDAVATLTVMSGAPRSGAGPGYDFVHRLAPPLDSQQVALRLSRLDDEDASSTLYGLAALLAAATGIGLFALYRAVAVQVAFAERRNNFVSAVTHELRTPLTAIRMYGEMLRDGMVQDDATRQEYYATITAEGERLTRLINNVMEHAKLRRGQRHAHLERGDVGPVVRDVVELMTPHVEREGFAITLRAGSDLPHVRFDVDALKQILFNVIDNALKYGRGGDARIEVTCEADGDGVAIGVRDFGPGIDQAQLASVFEPFFRGESELTRRQKGTGLGLALVRDLVELMNGSVCGVSRAPGFEIRVSLRRG